MINNSKRPSLAIIIITANRKESVAYWLQLAGEAAAECAIDIIVYDSSVNMETQQFCQQFEQKGFQNIFYDKYDGAYDKLSIDQKLISAYKKYASRYDYLWAVRDGLVVNIKGVFPALYALMKQNYDLIVLDEQSRDIYHHGNQTYTNCVKLFLEQCQQMTILGVTILKSSHVSKMLEEVPLDQEKNYAIWQPMAYLTYFADKPFHAASWVGPLWLPALRQNTSSFWHKRVLWQWGERWYKAISSLPNIYDSYKAQVMKFELIDCKPFSVSFLVYLRQSGWLNWREVHRYAPYLPTVSKTPLWLIYLIACIPVFLLGWIQSMKRNYIHFMKKHIYRT